MSSFGNLRSAGVVVNAERPERRFGDLLPEFAQALRPASPAGLPTISAVLIAPIEMPATQFGATFAVSSAS